MLSVDPRSIPVRFSRLRALARSPLHYLHACQEDSPDTLARKLGRGAHALVLGQPVALWAGTTDSGRAKPRAGAVWDDFAAAHAGAEILNETEFRQARAINEAIRNHPIASEMIYGPNTLLEHEVNWTYRGRACQSHLDIYRKGSFVADLKTCRDSSPAKFGRTAFFDAYHAQLAFYVMAAEALGHPTPDAYVIAVESAPPNAVTVMRLSAYALEAGRAQCLVWLEQLLACEAANEWPAYSQSIVELEVPDMMGAITFVPDEPEEAIAL